jgi:hypothetical protein
MDEWEWCHRKIYAFFCMLMLTSRNRSFLDFDWLEWSISWCQPLNMLTSRKVRSIERVQYFIGNFFHIFFELSYLPPQMYNVEYEDGDFEDHDVMLTLTMFGHLPRPPKRWMPNSAKRNWNWLLSRSGKRQSSRQGICILIRCVYSVYPGLWQQPNLLAHCAPLTLLTRSSSRASCSALFLAAWLSNTEIKPMPHCTLKTIFHNYN